MLARAHHPRRLRAAPLLRMRETSLATLGFSATLRTFTGMLYRSPRADHLLIVRKFEKLPCLCQRALSFPLLCLQIGLYGNSSHLSAREKHRRDLRVSSVSLKAGVSLLHHHGRL
jgi:hypothetical protein